MQMINMQVRLVRTDIAIVWRPWNWRCGRWEVESGAMWVQRGPIAIRYEAEFVVA